MSIRPQLSQLPDWPAALSFKDALAYTGLAATVLREHAREGRIKFLPRGPKGENICQRAALDALLQSMWAAESGAALEDMDFGDG